MRIDGFRHERHDAFVGYDRNTADRVFRRVNELARRCHVDVQGLHRIPNGRAILVANHAFAWDVIFPVAAIWCAQRRPVWVLGEHLWWRVPFLRKLAAACGIVDGTPENMDRLLERDELVLVLPGGLREAVKPRELHYRLLWGHRYGFVRAAIRNQSPIVPLASIGAEDLFDFVGNAYRRGERWLHRAGLPIPLPSRILPIPHLVPWRFVVGDPIPPRALPAQTNDVDALRSLRHEVEGALHEIFETELAERAGIDLA
jgi:1-acyl-sn-glycerol-3-phosphate acyltransferase